MASWSYDVRHASPCGKPNPQPKKEKEEGGFRDDPALLNHSLFFCSYFGFSLLGLLGVEVLLKQDAELLPEGLELLEVLLVLALVLDLGFDAYARMLVFLCLLGWGVIWHTLKDADGSGIVVDTSCGAESGCEDRGGGDQVVGKSVVQVALGGGRGSG